MQKSPAAINKLEDMSVVNNHDLVYNSAIDKAIADDKSNFYSGHFLDTVENRKIIWYDNSALGIDGIASLIIKAFFNSRRSDESSKKLCPATIGATVLTAILEIIECLQKQADIIANLWPFEQTWLNQYLWPQECMLDQGSKFIGDVISLLRDEYGIIRKPSIASCNPQTNSMVERVHKRHCTT